MISVLFVIVLSFGLTACGSSDSKSSVSNDVGYNGPATEAAITADNAKLLSTQAVAFGLGAKKISDVTTLFIEESDEKQTLAKAFGALSPKASFSVTNLGYGGFEAIYEILEDDDFPNISSEDSLSNTLELTITENTATVSGEITFADVEHCAGEEWVEQEGNVCQSRLEMNGTATVSITFDTQGYGKYLLAVNRNSYIAEEEIPELEGLKALDTMEALSILLRSEALFYNRSNIEYKTNLPYTSSFVFEGAMTAKQAYFIEKMKKERYSRSGGFTFNTNGTIDISDAVSFSNFAAPEGLTEPGYIKYDGTESSETIASITGTADFTYNSVSEIIEPDDKSNDITDIALPQYMFMASNLLSYLHFVYGNVDITASIDGSAKLSLKNVYSETPKGEEGSTYDPSNGYNSDKTNTCTVTASGDIDIQANLLEAVNGQDVNLSVSITDGALSYSSESDQDKDFTSGTKYTDTVNKDENSNATVSGAVKIDYTTTITVITPVSQKLSIDLNGSVSYVNTADSVIIYDRTDAVPANHINTTTSNSTYEGTASGKLNISQADNYFNISADKLYCLVTVNDFNNADDTDLNYTYRTINTDVENLLVATNGIDLGISGSAITQMGYTISEEDLKIKTDDYVLITSPSLIFNDNTTGKSYKYENYKIELSDVDAVEPAVDFTNYPLFYDHDSALISGTFYNSDFGSVTVNGDFKFEFEAIYYSVPSKEFNSIDVVDDFFDPTSENFTNAFPSFGSMTITGLSGSTATLTARNSTVIPDLPEVPEQPESAGYSVTFGETTTDYDWFDINALYQGVIRTNWLFIAGTSIADSYINIFQDWSL